MPTPHQVAKAIANARMLSVMAGPPIKVERGYRYGSASIRCQ